MHYLLLVKDYAISGLQDRLKAGMRIFNACAAVLASDEIIDHSGLQRPRTKQGDQSNDLFEVIRLQALN